MIKIRRLRKRSKWMRSNRRPKKKSMRVLLMNRDCIS
jgi:hypothetical protein